MLISAMALGPVGRAYTPDWAARLRRRVKTFDDIVFTADARSASSVRDRLVLSRHSSASYYNRP